jgi:hypothetical protein
MSRIDNYDKPGPGKSENRHEWALLLNQRANNYSMDPVDSLHLVFYCARWYDVEYQPLAKWLVELYGRGKKFDLSTFSVQDRNKILELVGSLRLEEYEIIINLKESDSLSLADIIPNNVVSLKLRGHEEIGGRIIFNALKRLPKLRELELQWDVEILNDGMYRSGRWFTFADVYGLRALEEKDMDFEDRDNHDVWTYEITMERDEGWKWVKSLGINRQKVVVKVNLPKFEKEVMKWFELSESLKRVFLDFSDIWEEIE